MIELALLPQHLQLEPGGLTRATVTLHAADAPAATYVLEIHGLEQSWYTLSVPEVTVAPQGDGQAVLTLHPPLEAARGVYPFELLASHPEDPAMGGRIEALLVIEAAEGEATAVAVPVASAPLVATPLSRRSALIAAAAIAALLLCVGVVYGLGKRSSANHTTAAPPCASPATVGCTPSPTATKDIGNGVGDRGEASRTPTSASTGLPSGTLPTPHSTAAGAYTPTTGSLPIPGNGAHAAGSATATDPAPASSPTALAAVLPGVPPHGLTFPGLPGSPAHPGEGGGAVVPANTGSGTATAGATPSETVTATPTETATAGSSATQLPTLTPTVTPVPTTVLALTATPSPRPTTTVPPRPTATPQPTATVPPTSSLIPTAPPRATPTVPPTTIPSPAATAGNSPTPAIVRLQYSYEIVDNQFTLKWLTENAVALAVDGQLETVPVGAQSYPLQTHTYELIATGADGSRQIKAASVMVVGDCEVMVNGLQTTVKSDRCRLLQQSQTQLSPTPTVAPTLTAVPITPAASATALPTSAIPANAFPTETPALTYTPVPSDTPVPAPTAFPSDTPSPTPSTPGQDTPVGGT